MTTTAAIENKFRITSDFRMMGDQPRAVDQLVAGLESGMKTQTLLGVTGSGKTFTMANIVERVQRPTLVIAPNKTLAAQLATEFKEYFADNPVEYFVSYYDYYQPEAYIPRTDLYIEKDADINEEIDKLRHAATRSLLSRRDVLIVASVSCIYGLGDPAEYHSFVVNIQKGERRNRKQAGSPPCGHAVRAERHGLHPRPVPHPRRHPGNPAGIRGDRNQDRVLGRRVERIVEVDPLTGEILGAREWVDIYPAKHFVTSTEKLNAALVDIEEELQAQVEWFRSQDRPLEAARLEQRTHYDLEMLREAGYCSGIENYSRPLARRSAGSTPWTLLDYFPTISSCS